MDTKKIKSLLEEVKNGTKTEEDVTKEIMKDYGTAISDEQAKTTKVQGELDTAKTKITTYETEIQNLKDSSQANDDWKSKFEKLDAKIKQDEAAAKAKAEDEILTNNIVSVFPSDKNFTSDYVKNGLIADIKTELNKPENKGKGIKDIFESLTKDKQGIFENPNKPKDMPGMGNVDTSTITKDDLAKMSYKQRLELKQQDPNRYEELKK